ncbi:MAG: NAD(P)/FAD-dependent oxidoreductase [Ruegeria sp.]
MPFEYLAGAPRKIAVVGGGISGMGAANLLAANHRVTLFEAEQRLGGHARTVIAGKRGNQPVDTGFIVFNKVTYPNLVQLFRQLNVPVVQSNMSFGVSARGGAVEYALNNLDALFAQRRNLWHPRFLRMVSDLLRFNSKALQYADDHNLTVGDLLDRLGTGDWFRSYYLEPFSGAIWSLPGDKVLEFPAHAMIRFFDNHLLLDNRRDHVWYTVQGGSVEYVKRLTASMGGKGVGLRLNTHVNAVRRTPEGPQVKTAGGDWEIFDEVVFATHSDDTLRLLSDAAPSERDALSPIRYQTNRAVLHADTSLMPVRRKCWASWVHTQDIHAQSRETDVTYWMNSLQRIPHDDPLFVTLNSRRRIREELIFDEAVFQHPIFDLPALLAQQRIKKFNGSNRTWFCGAWMGNGFHEDGLASAVAVAEAIDNQVAGPIAAE